MYNSGKIFTGKSVICFISGTESRGKLKFSEVSLQICQNFWTIEQKNFPLECPLNFYHNIPGKNNTLKVLSMHDKPDKTEGSAITKS